MLIAENSTYEFYTIICWLEYLYKVKVLCIVMNIKFYSDIGVACTRSGFKLQLTVRLARANWHHRKTLSNA